MDEAIVYLKIMFVAVFVQNFVLAQFLGLCPFIGVSKKRDAAFGMGMAVIFVMTLASIVTMLIYRLLLLPFGMEAYLDIVSFIVVIASLVQFVEMAVKKLAPALYQALGIYLPLITTNCAVLGVTQINVNQFGNGSETLLSCLAKSTVNGIFAGIGFTLAMILMAGIRERLEGAPIPKALKGVPIAFICAGCMALAFFGFAGFV
ncbi:MAG: electron transport complex protein RnfA [Planctomycetota bacterium]|jgi:electron transport complex protein RnfA